MQATRLVLNDVERVKSQRDGRRRPRSPGLAAISSTHHGSTSRQGYLANRRDVTDLLAGCQEGNQARGPRMETDQGGEKRHNATPMSGWTARCGVVTGANSGVGLALAKRLAAAGAHVVIVCARDETRGETARPRSSIMQAICRPRPGRKVRFELSTALPPLRSISSSPTCR